MLVVVVEPLVVDVSVVVDPGYEPDVSEDPPQAHAAPAPVRARTAVEATAASGRFALYMAAPVVGGVMSQEPSTAGVGAT